MLEVGVNPAATGHAPTAPEPDGPWDEDEVLDQALRLIADHYRELGGMLGRPAFSPSLAELRRSPLGQDLRLLAAAGRGADSGLVVRQVARRVTETLLRPPAAEEYAEPAWFRATALGRLLARAERACLGEDGVLTPVEVADRLGVPEATVADWLTEGVLDAVPDEDGRPLVPRAAVERRRLVALDLAPIPSGQALADDVLLAEQSLAS